ncbi:hypothetical protein PZA11_006935 [Diplocarpon coronariae]|uniref:ATP-dependent RNA helicase n=1 Tax=Diplocarpon coronariae TaxID=2795749 RepID=A0A218YYM6_9HELO|nr:ATP-dependent RNA helicase [Marssonina coronariae]
MALDDTGDNPANPRPHVPPPFLTHLRNTPQSFSKETPPRSRKHVALRASVWSVVILVDVGSARQFRPKVGDVDENENKNLLSLPANKELAIRARSANLTMAKLWHWEILLAHQLRVGESVGVQRSDGWR